MSPVGLSPPLLRCHSELSRNGSNPSKIFIDVRGLSPETKALGDQLIDAFSSELHNYYVYEFHLQNYASRHAKLVRLISSLNQHIHSMKDYMIMAKIFDIFICDLYESELFDN